MKIVQFDSTSFPSFLSHMSKSVSPTCCFSFINSTVVEENFWSTSVLDARIRLACAEPLKGQAFKDPVQKIASLNGLSPITQDTEQLAFRPAAEHNIECRIMDERSVLLDLQSEHRLNKLLHPPDVATVRRGHCQCCRRSRRGDVLCSILVIV